MSAPSGNARIAADTLLDLLDARGVVSINFADGSQLNCGSLSLRAALGALMPPERAPVPAVDPSRSTPAVAAPSALPTPPALDEARRDLTLPERIAKARRMLRRDRSEPTLEYVDSLLDVLRAALEAGEADTPTPVKWLLQKGEHHTDNVYVEQREQRDGSMRYVVVQQGHVLASDGRWEYEPLPSSRTDEFIARTRHATLADAVAAYRAAPLPETTDG